MNDLEKFFWQESDRYINKWTNYFRYYDRYFCGYRNRPIKLLEIGVSKGGSLQMWRNYFSKESLIVGMDIDVECINYNGEGIEIFIGDQSNVNDLSELVNKYKSFDIIIDDGSHVHTHQIETFKYLYDYLNMGGTYLVEDTHTSYWTGFKNESPSFIEFSKDIIDDLTAYHANDGHVVNNYTKSLSGIYFHDSMVFFEKSGVVIEPARNVFSVGMKNSQK